MAKKASKVKEQTVVVTIQATYILKGKKCVPADTVTMDAIDLNVCPGADNVEIKSLKVFEKDE